MTGTAKTSLSLRAVHCAVFLTLSALALGAGWPEWTQLWLSQTSRFHFGAPPRALPLAGAALCLTGSAGLLTRVLRRRPVPLGISGLVLAGFLMSVLSGPPLDAGRSWAAADLEVLRTARALHGTMVEALQRSGAVPARSAEWTAALAALAPSPPFARDRWFQPLSYQLVWQANDDTPLIPGQLRVLVPPHAQHFELRAVGFDRAGKVATLRDERGDEVVLRGAHDPDRVGEAAQR